MFKVFARNNLDSRYRDLVDLKMMYHGLSSTTSCKYLKELLQSAQTKLLIQPSIAHKTHTSFCVQDRRLYVLAMDFASFSSLRYIDSYLDFLHNRLAA